MVEQHVNGNGKTGEIRTTTHTPYTFIFIFIEIFSLVIFFLWNWKAQQFWLNFGLLKSDRMNILEMRFIISIWKHSTQIWLHDNLSIAKQ